MLHPDLGSSGDPLGTWQVDTDEIDAVVGLYSHHLAHLTGPEEFAKGMGLLWKKLAGTPRLARLVWAFAEMRLHGAADAARTRGRGEIRFVGHVLAALGRTPRLADRPPPPRSIEEDPLYDPWID